MSSVWAEMLTVEPGSLEMDREARGKEYSTSVQETFAPAQPHSPTACPQETCDCSELVSSVKWVKVLMVGVPAHW